MGSRESSSCSSYGFFRPILPKSDPLPSSRHPTRDEHTVPQIRRSDSKWEGDEAGTSLQSIADGSYYTADAASFDPALYPLDQPSIYAAQTGPITLPPQNCPVVNTHESSPSIWENVPGPAFPLMGQTGGIVSMNPTTVASQQRRMQAVSLLRQLLALRRW
ncbi:hypothetical protein N7513_001927 [Penicillium frequentans]|nr:hypothetical protein N7513_001927 [Penicillium glabrum]